MSEKLLRFLVSELKTVRIRCKGKHANGDDCRLVYEVDVGQLTSLPTQCQSCQQKYVLRPPLDEGSISNPFKLLRVAIERLRDAEGFQVEFVLPDQD